TVRRRSRHPARANTYTALPHRPVTTRAVPANSPANATVSTSGRRTTLQPAVAVDVRAAGAVLAWNLSVWPLRGPLLPANPPDGCPLKLSARKMTAGARMIARTTLRLDKT